MKRRLEIDYEEYLVPLDDKRLRFQCLHCDITFGRNLAYQHVREIHSDAKESAASE
jgi:hypothetical protein